MPRLLSLLLAFLVATSALFGALPTMAQETPRPWPTKEWATSSPEEQGMSSERLARLVEFGGFNDMDSLLVTRHGRIVLETTYAPFRAGLKHRINSATKAVVSTLIAMAIRDGKLDSTDRHVVAFFADRTIANLDERKKAITIRHLLDMTSGLEWSEGLDGFKSFLAMERSPDWQQFILDRPMSEAPGTLFYYDSGNSHLLSAILSKVTGRSALDYARETLFGPLGIDDVTWRADPQGVSGGGAGLYMHPRDLAKIGYLYLRGGMWEGKQVLPASWIDGVRKANVDMRESWAQNLRYGSQFWVMPARDVYMAVGYDRQLIVVMPKLDIVAVATGSARFPSASGMPTRPRYSFDTLVGSLVAAATGDAPLPANPAATAELARLVKEAAAERPGPVGEQPAMAKTISGKTWRFAPNELRIKWVTYKLDGAEPSFEYEVEGGPATPAARFGGPIGFDGYYSVGGRQRYGLSAARGRWLSDGTTFVLETQTLGNDDAARVTHVFGDRTVEVNFEAASGYKTTLKGRTDD
ncbi:MAG: serine hydrolase [Rhodospirillales bacterium]|nr:serine hydrolase [Rhodospirillales bacterium]